jgi:hypothetical protein
MGKLNGKVAFVTGAGHYVAGQTFVIDAGG